MRFQFQNRRDNVESLHVIIHSIVHQGMAVEVVLIKNLSVLCSLRLKEVNRHLSARFDWIISGSLVRLDSPSMQASPQTL